MTLSQENKRLGGLGYDRSVVVPQTKNENTNYDNTSFDSKSFL